MSADADAADISRQTAGKWFKRYMESGTAGLVDANLRPHLTRPGVPQKRCRRIIKARLLLKRGPHFLAWRLKTARSTIYAVLRRYGLSRLKSRQREPFARYEWPDPGDLVHLNVKKLGRIPEGGGWRVHGRAGYRKEGGGWEYVRCIHVQQRRVVHPCGPGYGDVRGTDVELEAHPRACRGSRCLWSAAPPHRPRREASPRP